VSSGKQTIPQIPWMTTGTPQPEHYAGSSFQTAYDIWPGSLIYYLTRTSLKLTQIGKKIPGRIFVNVLDCDFTGKLQTSPGLSDVVALYIQAHASTPTGGCHIFAINSLVDKSGVFPAHCAEFDFNNNSGQDDPPYGDTNSGVCVDLEAGDSKNSTLYGLVIGQSQLADGKKPFRQAISVYQSFDTIGLLLKSAVSKPDAYIYLLPWDDLNPTTRMITLMNADRTQEVFALQKDGLMKIASPTSGADCLLLNATDSLGIGNLLIIRNGKIPSDIALFNADGSIEFPGSLRVDVSLLVTGPITANGDIVSWGANGYYGNVKASSFNPSGGTAYFAGIITTTGAMNVGGLLSPASIQTATYKAGDGTVGVSEDIAVSAGTATVILHFKNGLYVGHT
jgi:hypothetical protein